MKNRTIEAIEPQSILEWPHFAIVLEQLFGPDQREILSLMKQRLEAGETEYGTAWTRVNLTESIREEVVDIANYLALSVARTLIAKDMDPALQRWFYQLASAVEDLWYLLSDAPEFEEKHEEA